MNDVVSTVFERRGAGGSVKLAALLRAPVSNAGLLRAMLLLALAPVAIFATFLQPVASASLLTAVALSSSLILRSRAPGGMLAKPIDPKIYAICTATGTVLCLLGGEYHLFFATWDWFTRDAVLADLVSNKFPVSYHYMGSDFVLRAPLAMYMTPAMIGWAFGLKTAHLALLVQNSFLFAGVFYFLASIVTDAKLRFLILFIMSGPIDIAPNLVESFLFPTNGAVVIEPHLMFWNKLARFWSQLPQLFWAPNHAFPGWMIGVLLLLHLRREIDIALLAVASVFLVFWSPLVMIGALPLLLAAGWRSLSPTLLSSRNALTGLAGSLMAPLLAYLSMDSAAMNRGWLIENEGFFFWYPLALFFGLPQLWLLLFSRDVIPSSLKSTFYGVSAILVLFPLYRFGASSADNEMTMRCMMTPMFLLGFLFAEAAPRLIERGWPRSGLTMMIIFLSSMTGLMEIRRALTDPVYPINDCNLLTVASKIAEGPPGPYYLAHIEKLPGWLASAEGRRLHVEDRQCWPEYPLMPAR